MDSRATDKRLMARPGRPLILIAIVAVILTAGASGAVGYEILLDHDIDSDPTTIKNTSVGPLWERVNIVVAFTPEELVSPPAQIVFDLEFDCTGDPGSLCVSNHGQADLFEVPADEMFSNFQESSCAAITCECIARRQISVDVAPAQQSGITHRVLATYVFKRVGFEQVDAETCEPRVYSFNEFRTPDATFLLSDSPMPVEHSTWGGVKSLYGR